MTTIVIICLGAIAFILFSLRYGPWQSAAAAFLVSAIVFPSRLTHWNSEQYTGIASSSIEIYTFSLVLLLVALTLLLKGRSPVPKAYVPLVAILCGGSILVWGSNSVVHAGDAQLLVGVIACAFGIYVGRRSMTDDKSLRFLLTVVLAIVLFEVLISIAQLAGLPINPLDPSTARLMGSRVNGTMNHPNNLGKAMLLLIVFALPSIRSEVKTVRRLAFASVLGAALPLFLSGGRANIIGAILVISVFSLLSRGYSGRAVLPIAAFAGLIPFLGYLVDRFQEDPTGGSRDYLTGVALRQLKSVLFTGVGPNSYVKVVGQTDALTATGLPVHDSFLLALVELGIFGCLALYLPVILWFVKAWRRRLDAGSSSHFAVAFISSIAAIALVGATGWGLLAGSILPLWLFVSGVLVANFNNRSTSGDVKVSGKRTRVMGLP